MNNTIETKKYSWIKTFLAVVVSLIVVGILFPIIRFITTMIGGLILIVFGVHYSQYPDIYNDVGDIGSIIGGISAIYFAGKIYKKIARGNTDPNAPPKKWYQFKGFN